MAPPFLAWLDAPKGRRWLDIGCGTGALCAAVAEHCAPASLTGVEPSEGFLKLARETLGDRAELHVGNAASIPVGSASAGVVVSGLVLNFIPDLPAALAEIARVGVKGALFGAYVWDYAGRMDLMRHFWDAAVALDASAAGLDEGVRFPLCQPDALRTALIDAGYTNPEVTAIDVPTVFTSFDDYWTPFLGGQGPAPSYVAALDAAARDVLRGTIHRGLPVQADGSIALVARAWAVRAIL